MAAEIEELARRLGAPVVVSAPPPPLEGRRSLEDRIRADRPPPGVTRFYNTAFKMPERPRRGE